MLRFSVNCVTYCNTMLLYVALVLINITVCKCANILAIIPTPSYSHHVVFQPLWKELSLRGHTVTVVTTNPVKDPTLSNLTEIDMSYIYEAMEEKFNRKQFVDAAKGNPLKSFLFWKGMQQYVLEENLNHPWVQKLINNRNNQKYDVVLVEIFFTPMYAVAELYNCPLIVISSMDAYSRHYNLIGNPINPATHPDMTLLQMVPPLSFKERLISTVSNVLLFAYLEYFDNPDNDEIIRKYFGSEVPGVRELTQRSSLIFVNVHPIFYPVKPVIPSVILIGDGSYQTSTVPLSKDLEYFMGNSTEGVIYFSLGSNVNIENIGSGTLKDIIEVFEQLPYNVVWKFDANYIGKPSKKLYLSKWLPQKTILENANVKLFITHGGCQSLDETVYSHVPILGLPFFGDQESNIKRMVSKGIGLLLDPKSITKDSFKNAILEVISNPQYRNKVVELAVLAQDQPMTGLERAVWWTEYVIRHKGAKHLRSPFIDLPNYQYYHLDVILFCLSVVCVVVYTVVKIIRLLFSLVKYKFETKQKAQ